MPDVYVVDKKAECMQNVVKALATMIIMVSLEASARDASCNECTSVAYTSCLNNCTSNECKDACLAQSQACGSKCY
jgi:hypothetical protein